MATRKRSPASPQPSQADAARVARVVPPDVPITLDSAPAAVDDRMNTAATKAATFGAFRNTNVDDQVRETVMRIYGPGMAAAMANPEVLGLFRVMFSDGSIKNPDQVEMRLRGTNWYRNQSTSQRSTTQLEVENPGEAIRQMQDVRRSLTRIASRYGVQVDSATLDSIANDAWRNGWANDQDRIQQAILGNFDASKGMGQGSIAGTAANIRAKMRKYGLPASDTSVAQWSIQIVNGTLDPDALDEMIMSQAKAKYPHLADMIDRGLTPDDYYQPFKQTLADELEMNPEDIDFDKPEWSPVIDGGGTGKAMTLTETRRFARSKEQWRNTDAANRQSANMEMMVLRAFGKVA